MLEKTKTRCYQQTRKKIKQINLEKPETGYLNNFNKADQPLARLVKTNF